jgi:hypothetical protein
VQILGRDHLDGCGCFENGLLPARSQGEIDAHQLLQTQLGKIPGLILAYGSGRNNRCGRDRGRENPAPASCDVSQNIVPSIIIIYTFFPA